MSRQEEEEPEICYGSIGPADSYLWPAALRKLNRLFNQRHQKEFNVIVIGICKNKKRVTHDEPPLPKELYQTAYPPAHCCFDYRCLWKELYQKKGGWGNPCHRKIITNRMSFFLLFQPLSRFALRNRLDRLRSQ